MNMKKTIAAVAASAMAISAIAVPANAAVENAVATGTSFTYSLVKEYTQQMAGTANVAASFNANPATDKIVIDLTGTANEAPVTITATAVDGDVRFTPFTFTRSGAGVDSLAVKAGIDLNGSILTIAPGAFSKSNVEATFTVSGLANIGGGDGSVSLHYFKRQDLLTEFAKINNWLNVTVTEPGSYSDAQITAAKTAQADAITAEKANIEALAKADLQNIALANQAALADAAVKTAAAAVEKAQAALDAVKGTTTGGTDVSAYETLLAQKRMDLWTAEQELADLETAASLALTAITTATEAVRTAAQNAPAKVTEAAVAADLVDTTTGTATTGLASTAYDEISEVHALAFTSVELFAFDDAITKNGTAAVSADGSWAVNGTYNAAIATGSIAAAKSASTAANGFVTAKENAITVLEGQIAELETLVAGGGAGEAVDTTKEEAALATAQADYDKALSTASGALLDAYAAAAVKASQAAIDQAGQLAYDKYLAGVTAAGDPTSNVPNSWRLSFSGFTAAGTQTIKRPYKSFANYENDGPANIIEWLSTKVEAGKYSGYQWQGDADRDGVSDPSERNWVADKQMLDSADVDNDGNVTEPAWSVNNYVNVQAVINDCIANYPNVTFTFNTATDNVVTPDSAVNGNYKPVEHFDTYSGWGSTDLYKNAFKQYIYNNFGSDPSTYVPFDPGAYFTNGVGYNLFTGALIINDLYTMQLADTEMFSYNATSLVFDYQALKENNYADYNSALNMIYSMKLATSVPWYWDSMTVSFAAASDDTAESDAGTTSEDEPLPEDPAEEAPAEEVETLPAPVETEAPATEAPAPVAPAENPGTGNAPVALAVIPVALAAAAIIAKKRK